MHIHKYPRLFQNVYDVDMMCFNWNFDPSVISNNCVDPFVLETAGGIFYFGNTIQSRIVLNKWISALASPTYKLKADDRVLAIIFAENKLIHTTRVLWLPVEYFYIPEFFPHLKLDHRAVISHPDKITPEHEATSKSRIFNRIPSNYTIQHSVRNQVKYNLLPTNTSQLNTRLQNHGFHFDKLYSLPIKKCSANNVIKLNPSSVTPSDILRVWEQEKCKCDILIGIDIKQSDNIFDISTNMYNSKQHKMTFSPKNLHLFMKFTLINYNIVKQWGKTKDTSIRGFKKCFNKNAHHVLQSRLKI
jgi:hypothetical protein